MLDDVCQDTDDRRLVDVEDEAHSLAFQGVDLTFAWLTHGEASLVDERRLEVSGRDIASTATADWGGWLRDGYQVGGDLDLRCQGTLAAITGIFRTAPRLTVEAPGSVPGGGLMLASLVRLMADEAARDVEEGGHLYGWQS